ncbi:cytochrome P450 734A1 [Citrus sinensis]|nr:cytochrome P450 734A1 [Citrus sinensis]
MIMSSSPMQLSHQIFPITEPHIYSWIKLYGTNFLMWHGSQAELVVAEPKLIKEIMNNNRSFPKREPREYLKLLGNGLVTTRGEKWLKKRKLAVNAFHAENLKNMIPDMIASVDMMLERWRDYEGKEIDAYREIKVLTSEIISRTAFGSCYLEGENIFNMLTKMAYIVAKKKYKLEIPGIGKLLKTNDDIESDKLEQDIRDSIIKVVKKRESNVLTGEAESYGNDLLGILMRAYHSADETQKISLDDLIDECKTFYVAGTDTTASLLSWTIFLLAIHSDWQDKARKEVLELLGQQNPSADNISRLKIVGMIINETLRLYPPFVVFVREVKKEVKLGDLIVPANVDVTIPVIAVHHDPQIWGEDFHLYKPERFAQGVPKATSNNMAAFLPFGLGPRTCVGFNFTIIEAKIALSMILRRYKFTLSPNYVHSPVPLLIRFINKLWWNPIWTQSQMRSQGIKGPSYKFIHGNTKEIINMTNEIMSSPMELTHQIFPRVYPQVYSWIKLYGTNFLMWNGLQPQLVVAEPDLIKEILNDKDRAYPKREPTNFIKKFLGDGLVTTQGEKWFKQRKLANHAFHVETLKSMIPDMIASVEMMLERWRDYEGKEIDAYKEFKVLTSEIISRTAFGSSYLEGENIFNMLTKLAFFISKNEYKVRIPLIGKLVKTRDDTESDKVEQDIRDSVIKIVENREKNVITGEVASYGDDLLGALMMAYHDVDVNQKISLDDLIDESFHILRKVQKEVKLGKFIVPGNLDITIPVIAVHHDPQIWGEDAHLFKPERFAEGVAKATNNNVAAFIPFGLGPRTCVGLNYAITEAKIALSMILQRYKFTPSPTYVHSPVAIITINPQHGLQVLVHRL